MNKAEFKEFLEKSQSNFRFRYLGGGYFRDKNIPMAQVIEVKVDSKIVKKLKTEKADISHGGEIIEEFCKELIKQYENN